MTCLLQQNPWTQVKSNLFLLDGVSLCLELGLRSVFCCGKLLDLGLFFKQTLSVVNPEVTLTAGLHFVLFFFDIIKCRNLKILEIIHVVLVLDIILVHVSCDITIKFIKILKGTCRLTEETLHY